MYVTLTTLYDFLLRMVSIGKYMKQQGLVSKWNDEKGFGFIEDPSGKSVFFHISEFRANRTPKINESVYFILSTDKQNRPCATQVQEYAYVKAKQEQKKEKHNKHEQQQNAFKNNQKLKISFAILFLTSLFILSFFKYLNWVIPLWYCILSVVCFAFYAKDKSAAQSNSWRVSENTLHLLALIGGWAGALMAQTLLRHKSQKHSFRVVYILTVILNLIVLGLYLFSV